MLTRSHTQNLNTATPWKKTVQTSAGSSHRGRFESNPVTIRATDSLRPLGSVRKSETAREETTSKK